MSYISSRGTKWGGNFNLFSRKNTNP